MRHGIAHDAFYQLAAALDLSEQHRPLDHRETVVGGSLFTDLRVETAARLLPDEERRELHLGDFEDQVQILTNELVVLRDLAADGAKRAAARHAKAFLQGDLRQEPLLEVVPRPDVVVERAASLANRLEVHLQDLVNEALFIPEVVIELSFAGARRVDDLIRARGRHALL